MKNKSAITSLMLCMGLFSGCSTQAWYEGAKQSAENNCRNQSPSESESCMEKLNKKSYEEYENERSGKK